MQQSSPRLTYQTLKPRDTSGVYLHNIAGFCFWFVIFDSTYFKGLRVIGITGATRLKPLSSNSFRAIEIYRHQVRARLGRINSLNRFPQLSFATNCHHLRVQKQLEKWIS